MVRWRHIVDDVVTASIAVVAVVLTWYGGWVALEAVAVAAALLLTAWSLWLLRQDHAIDYLRSLVPWVAVRVGKYDASWQYIPLTISATAAGIAYNVIVNLFPMHPTGNAIVGEPAIPQLAAGESYEVRISMVHHPFLGRLEVGYFDPTGLRHIGWNTANCAHRRLLRTQGVLRWYCKKGCRVHPQSIQPK
jgi:hypothetical protein